MRFQASLLAVATALLGLAQAQVAKKSGLTSDSHCGSNYCFTALYDASKSSINYTLVVPQGNQQIGWWAVAQGTQMVGANMAINWINADMSVTTSHRSTTAQVMPTEAGVTVQSFSVNSDVSKTSASETVWSWNMPMPANAQANSVSHVFAMSPTSPSSSSTGATLVKHNRHDTGITLDLTKAYTGAAPAGLASATSSNGGDSGETYGSSDSSDGSRELNKTNNLYIAHMVFMIIGWMICFPAGILIARYGRTFFTWFPKHRMINTIGFVAVFIGFFLAIGAVASDGGPHFSNTHEKLGLAMFILLFAQIALGALSHSLKQRRNTRIVGFIHIPFGLILFGLSVYQIHEGFEEWDWGPPSYASYIIYAWAGVMALVYLAGFALLPKELRQNREQPKIESSSEESYRRPY